MAWISCRNRSVYARPRARTSSTTGSTQPVAFACLDPMATYIIKY